MNKVIHRNDAFYGKTSTIILADGYACVMVSVMDETPEVAVIHDLIVHSTRRGEGLGRALLESAEEEAKEMGAEIAALSAKPGSWLEEWYTRHGFHPTDDKDTDNYGNIILRKAL